MTSVDFDAIMAELSRSLCRGRMRNDTAFVSTAVTYPNGIGVTVRIDNSEQGFLVSDDGYAELIAEEMGATGAFHRVAGSAAGRNGLAYENGAILIRDVERSGLPVAVTAVANASAKLLERLNASLEQPRLKRSREVFKKRLSEAFGTTVAFDVDYQGLTGRKWTFSAGIYRRAGIERLFELVPPSTQGVALANMKISDASALADAPIITAALIDYEATEPALRSILSHAGSLVIAANDDIAKYKLQAAN